MSENNSALHDLLTQEEIDALLKVDNKKLSDLIKVSSDRKKCPTFEKNINFCRIVISFIHMLNVYFYITNQGIIINFV